MPKQVFLGAADGRPLTKRFTIDHETGQVIKHPYPHVRRFNSEEIEWSNISTLYKALKEYSKRGWCALKGEINRPLFNESRAGSTDPMGLTCSLTFDADGLKGFSCGRDVLALVSKTPAYIEQQSASSGIVSGDALYAHLFMQMERDITPDKLKWWMKWLNLNTPEIREQMTLTRSKNALHWPLDVTINQNDKLTFLSDPICEDGIVDPNKGKRIKLRNPKGGLFPVDEILAVNPEKVKKAERERMNELREEAGLPRSNMRTKQFKGTSVASSPLEVNVTGLREGDDFVYLNLNGGNSWGYYFSITHPHVLYNFKGEQNYALKDVAPSLYNEYAGKAVQAQQEKHDEMLKTAKTGKVYLAFLEPERDMYYRGYHCRDTDTLVLDATSSVMKLQHFLKQNQQQMLEVVPEWRITFDPTMLEKIDIERRIINTYVPPPALSNVKKGRYPTIKRLMEHILAAEVGSETYVHHFNWLAHKLQNPGHAPGTAWLLHGIQGTGKNVWFNYVIKPLVGPDYCHVLRFEEFEEQFNSWAEKSLFVLFDEVQANDARSRSKLHAKLKNQITEPHIIVRRMRENPRTIKNRMAMYLASNKPDPMEIEATDRRINVANYQHDSASFINHAFIAKIEEELPALAYDLLNYEVDTQAVRTPLDNDAKRHIQHLTSNSMESFSTALRTGDAGYLYDYMPSKFQANDPDITVWENARRLAYISFVKRVFETYMEHPKHCVVRFSRDEIMTMTKYLIGKVPETPHKFTSFAKHYNIEFKRMRIEGRLVQGMEIVIPEISEELLAGWKSSWMELKPLYPVESKSSNED